MLVLVYSPYGKGVLVVVETLHINLMIKFATQEELDCLSHCWKRGTVATRIAMHQVQMAGKVLLTDQTDVKVTRNVKIQPFHTVETTGLSKVPNHDKHIYIIVKPTPVNSQWNEVYMMWGYVFMRVGSRWMGLTLRNLASRKVTLKRGTIVVHISATNKVSPMLAPNIAIKAATVNVGHSSAHPGADIKNMKEPMYPDVPWVHTCPPQEGLGKLFEKLDLMSTQGWSDK